MRRLALPQGGDWTQPRVLPDGSLLVIRRFDVYSDLYHVTRFGTRPQPDDLRTTRRRATGRCSWTTGSSGRRSARTATSVYFATDSPKPAPRQSYEVDFSLWSAPLGNAVQHRRRGRRRCATRWSVPDMYTGGDIEPVPLPDGSLLYSSYANTGKGTVVTVLGLQTRPEQPDAVAHHAAAGLRRTRGRGRRRDRGDGVHQLGPDGEPRGCDPRRATRSVPREWLSPTASATRHRGRRAATTFST